ncbi:substrate-binding domain-containing protein [Terrisporobacter vanillatitrophus]|uniref:substrate-binding domain-containing protein n=1 Tax=Terrisporobacter vanillatitrophus TaxID=3058402 RepID=UPI00336933CA
MKKGIISIITAAMITMSMVGCSSTGTDDTNKDKASTVKEITLVTTTSLDDTGFLGETLKGFEEENGVKVNVVAKGTGEALELGKSKDADILFVHAKQKEEDFIKEGYGVERTEIMYNYFIIVGPKDDPNNEKMSKLSAPEAFKYISDNNLAFTSRGDESGTHTKEKSLWEESGAKNDFKNYNEVGKGMAATLQMASEMKAYCLTDIGTFLATKDNLDLEVVKDADDSLKNVYSIVTISDLDKDKEEITNKLVEYYKSEDVQNQIKEYGVKEYGEPLFFVFE